MTTAASDPQIVPRQPASLPALRADAQGVGRRPGVRPRRQHQARLRRPVATLHRLVRRGGVAVDAGGPTHRGPLPGSACWLRRHHRHPAPGHLRHRQGPPVGRPLTPRSGPGRARLSERMGKAFGQAPVPGRCSHRRRAGRDPDHRRPAPPSRPRHRNAGAGRRARPRRRGPGGGAV